MIDFDGLTQRGAAWALRLSGAEQRGAKRWGPCPACGCDSGRGSVLCREGDLSWHCTRCGVSANAVQTMALLAVGELRPRDWGQVREWLESRGLADPNPGVVVEREVSVCGRLPALEPFCEAVDRARAAGVPTDLALRAAVEYRASRMALQEKRAAFYERYRTHPNVRVRRLAVEVWRAGHGNDNAITVPVRLKPNGRSMVI